MGLEVREGESISSFGNGKHRGKPSEGVPARRAQEAKVEADLSVCLLSLTTIGWRRFGVTGSRGRFAIGKSSHFLSFQTVAGGDGPRGHECPTRSEPVSLASEFRPLVHLEKLRKENPRPNALLGPVCQAAPFGLSCNDRHFERRNPNTFRSPGPGHLKF